MFFTVTLNPAIDKTLTLSQPLSVGEVNRVSAVDRRIGGKGINVACALQAEGMPVVAYALLGGQTGAEIAGTLAERGVQLCSIPCAAETRTNTKIVAADGSVTECNEPGGPIAKAEIAQLVRQLEKDAKDASEKPIVLLCGSSPQGVEKSVYNELVQVLHAVGCKVWVDSDGALLAESVLAKPDLIKPNLFEFSRLLGCDVSVETAVEKAASFYEKNGVSVLLTMGADGAVYAGAEGTMFVEAVPVQTYRTTVGAGDRFLALFAARQAAGATPKDAMSYAAEGVAKFLSVLF